MGNDWNEKNYEMAATTKPNELNKKLNELKPKWQEPSQLLPACECGLKKLFHLKLPGVS